MYRAINSSRCLAVSSLIVIAVFTLLLDCATATAFGKAQTAVSIKFIVRAVDSRAKHQLWLLLGLESAFQLISGAGDLCIQRPL